MDYKYIEQLLERYWECQTSLEEENILRAFFSQEDVPASLLHIKPLFACQQEEKRQFVLGNDFDEKVLKLVEEEKTVKAKRVSMKQRMMPFFKAAAIVAIILSLSNAMQMAFDKEEQAIPMAGTSQGNGNMPSVAMGDTVKIDTLQKAVQVTTPNQPAPAAPLIK